MKPSRFLLISSVVLFLSRLAACGEQPPLMQDQLVRAFLGIKSISARFASEADSNKWYWLGFAKFQKGKFLGYMEAPIVGRIDTFTNNPHFFAELGWGKKNGKGVYFVITDSVTKMGGEEEGEFFGKLADCKSSSVSWGPIDRLPEKKLNDWNVLGFAFGKASRQSEYTVNDDLGSMIKTNDYVVVFLMRTFKTGEEARSFARALPPITLEE